MTDKIFAIRAIPTHEASIPLQFRELSNAHEDAFGHLWTREELDQLREAYSATIDTFAWVILLLMFELETWTLDDRQFTKPVVLSLHGLRAACYVAILFAFVGYVDTMLSAKTPITSVQFNNIFCELSKFFED